MFDSFLDDTEVKYEIILSDKTVIKCTTSKLYDFYIFNEHNIPLDFQQLTSQLDAGYAITGDDTDFDFSSCSYVYKGKLILSKHHSKDQIKTAVTNIKVSNECKHEKKYINQAGGIRFWVCPVCKKDLGNV